MIIEGQTILFKFPQTDQSGEKLRPALVIRQLPGIYNDWLICMISSQINQGIPDFDEKITVNDSDFEESGLKFESLIRISRIAVVHSNIFLGKLGKIDNQRLLRIKQKISSWLHSVHNYCLHRTNLRFARSAGDAKCYA